ncbi:MAG TPA: hypothetical protein VMM58_11285 [Bacteroidota bacterium]|nr:hypothetical protein [Bacteroidota bacterium]
MSIMLDIIGSMIIRAAIMVTFLYLTINLQNALYEKTEYAVVKQKTVIPAQIMTDDIRLAGYGPTTSKVFPIAYPQAIEFYADINNDSTADWVHYYLGPYYTTGATTHRSLYREVSCISGGTAYELARDVVDLEFSYYDVNGSSVATGLSVSGIKSIKVSLTIEANAQTLNSISTARPAAGLYAKKTASDTSTASSFPSSYQKAIWERTIFPQNL